MAVTINASTTAGLVQTADTTGNLSLQSNGTTIAALTSTGLAVTGAGSFTTTLGVTGTSTTNIINAIKTTGGDTITFTNAAANNKTGFLYTDNDVVGLFTLANGQASANGVYFTSASAAVKVQVASSGVIGNFTSTGLTVTGTGKVSTGFAVGNATPGAGGLAFPATAVAVADVNTLDDYEEGTWSGAHASSVNFTGTPTLSNGRYTKIGNMVNVRGTISGTVTTANTLTYTVFGAPFTEAFRTSGAAFDNTNIKVGQSSAASSNIYLFFPAASAVPSGATEWDVNITYQV